MKSTKSTQSSRKRITIRRINNLVKKALANSPDWRPAKGYKYLDDTEEGSLFETGTGMRGVYLTSTPTSARVIVTSCNHPEEDQPYYLGKQNIANKTEVKNGNNERNIKTLRK